MTHELTEMYNPGYYLVYVAFLPGLFLLMTASSGAPTAPASLNLHPQSTRLLANSCGPVRLSSGSALTSRFRTCALQHYYTGDKLLTFAQSNGEDVLTFSKFGTMNTGQTEQTQAQVGHTEHDRVRQTPELKHGCTAHPPFALSGYYSQLNIRCHRKHDDEHAYGEGLA